MSKKKRKSRTATVRIDDIDVPLRDEPIGFIDALMRAMAGTPSAEDKAPRGDMVLVRRVNGQTEQVPLLDWHRQQLERHRAVHPNDLDWQAFEVARFKSIVEGRISLYDEIQMFVLRSRTTH
jgi:hypothetical protein